MKKALLSLIVMSFICSVTMGQDYKETRDVKGFSSIGFGISGNLYIKIGPEFSVILEGDKEDVNEVETEVVGNRLQIKHDTWRFNIREKVDVYITMPDLKGLGVSGSGKAEVLDEIETEDLDLSVSGSGHILTANITVENLDCSISGSGNIKLGGGKVIDAEVSISGSGSFYGEEARAETMEIGVSGSGSCRCYVTGSLEARVSGSGNITYSGDPRIDARVSGSGRVKSSN
jgi:hypothetical protein